MADKLSGAQQENLLTLLAFSDTAFRLVRDSVEPQLFTSTVYRDIVTRVHAYIDQFKRPPKDHLPDLLEDVLAADNAQSELYAQVLSAANEARETINEEYVLGQLESFVRQQQIKIGIVQAHQLVTDGDLDQAETVLEAALKNRLQLFHPGRTLRTIVHDLKVRGDVVEVVLLGMPELDRRRIGPARKELFLFIAPPGRGKSWFMMHVTKRALMQRYRCAVITLEMGEQTWGTRLTQALFALTRRQSEVVYARLQRDNLGRLSGLTQGKMKKVGNLADEKTLQDVEQKLEAMGGRLDVVVKEFPTRSLTTHSLRAYLDALERVERFTPDLLILDYADLMKVDPKNYRLELGTLYQDLRGLAAERNMMLVTASQANRAGAGARTVLDTHTAEDFSKIGTTDAAITYSQTASEKRLGLARLFVSKARMEEDRFSLLVTQSYATGQFCLDSIKMNEIYWDHLSELAGTEADVAEKPSETEAG